ncbi:prolipoprotein diacylglyceryl transferase [Metamycoplasma alkalescens]|uniref:Phosphatidylglycerol--prolipoprotein diacylglyceryl transferase n=5 Tax=Metamycoplasma alkalescens TaxID=45363 RepID=N9UAS7_9BACT|nr:prolipoprotein diacylglyceryl transferase [Metamycoplasma alkalescens]ENY54043.1 Prolipoprotein diacylglyceryl transferase [Metamycoplasma alkalescens 14918]PYF43630.1 phosphatidylglycerol:prolipoprotein diacylglycerol transferase [Metamycoplasma alkalescens]
MKDYAGVSLQIGPFYVYSLTMMLGMLSSILTVVYFWKREKWPFDQLAILIFIALPTAIIGARLFFVIQQLIEHRGWVNGPWYKMFFIWEGGLSIHGGVIVSTICCIVYVVFAKSAKTIDLKKAFSIILPAVLIGQTIGRWGNFANHEVYGQIMLENSLAFKILPQIIREHMFINGHYRLPLFLYESVANLIGYIILVWILNNYNWLKPGTTGALYILYYGIVRFGMEPLRQDNYNIYKVISALYIITGLVLLVLFEFVIKLNYNVYKIYKYRKEWTHKVFYFIVYEPKEARSKLLKRDFEKNRFIEHTEKARV